MYDFELYVEVVQKIKEYFGTQFDEALFLHGGCYWFASYLNGHLLDSYIMFNKEREHCAIEIQTKLYDITGRIASHHYVWASQRNIAYMKQHYIPAFDTNALESYLNQNVNYITNSTKVWGT